MARDWTLLPNDSWREEIKRYLQRLEKASSVEASTAEMFSELYQEVFFLKSEPEPLPEARIASRLGAYAGSLFGVATQVRMVVLNQWLSGQFTVVPLNTRFVFEIWGAIHFARRTLERLMKEGDTKREEERIDRLLFGARYPVELPFGTDASLASFNVLGFIDKLEKDRPGAREMYNFLSEASHPNMMQNMWFQLAGPPLANWQNESFKQHGHLLLNKALEAFEAAKGGMEEDVKVILEGGTDYIRKIAG
jgi:hypothetical protein